MPLVMRFVQGSKQMALVPKAVTKELHYSGDGFKGKTRLPGWLLNNANGPRDNGKRGKRTAKRKSKIK